ncbi:MAG: sulfatase-like hydrolase/transferase [Planctomycetota bacterium]|nr:sulfatase-like hydrolase/transferase [Planctomycetota bacterium]
MLRTLLAGLVVLAASASGLAAAGTTIDGIVVIVSDDHRSDLLGAAGHPVVQTPNLDRLAADGIRFDNAFVTTSICAASRASILTGLPERSHRHTFGRRPLARGLALASYPAVLRANGHRTGFVGKLGVGIEGGRETIDSMFDSFRPVSRTPYRKTMPDGSIRHATDLIGDHAVEFIESTPSDRPFCLSVSFNAGHAEDGDLADHYPPPATEADLHDGVPMPRPRLDDPAIFEAHPPWLRDSMNRHRHAWRWDEPGKYARNLRDYLRMLAGLDRNVGRILDALEREGRLDRTLVVFLGDNGYYMGERGFAGKWTHFEPSLRIPMIVGGAGLPAVGRGVVVDDMVLNLDVAPPVLAAAGFEAGKLAAGPPEVSGRPLQSLSEGPLRWGFLCEHDMKHPDIPRWVGIRTLDRKYARYVDHPEDGEFLHDLSADPDELVNLAGSEDEGVPGTGELGRTTDALLRAADSIGVPLPRVLLLGDSISMGYHEAVVSSLEGEAIVVRPKENCAGTIRGVSRIREWLALDGGGHELVHFNFGLHDLKRVDADGRNSNRPEDPPQSSIEAYETQLREIAAAILATNARAVFSTTTPVPEGPVRPHRDPADVDRYNAVARAVMKDLGIPVLELGDRVSPRLGDWQRPNDVHFTAEGSRGLGDLVASRIRRELRAMPWRPVTPGPAPAPARPSRP